MTGVLIIVVAVLMVLVMAMLQLLIVIRATATRRKRREQRLRPSAELSIAEYVSGGDTAPAPATRDERAVLLCVALDALADLRGSERTRLVALLERLGYVREAMAKLRSRRRVVRQHAAETLTAIAVPGAVPALSAGLADGDVLVRLTCARTLVEIGGDEVIPDVLATAERDLPAAPGAGAAVLLAVGMTCPDALAPLFARQVPQQVRAVAITVAGELRLSGLAPLLRSCLHEGDELAADAARGLGRIGDIEAVGELAEFAADDRHAPAARAAALTALGSIGDPSVLGMLERQLAAADWSVVAASARALARLGEPGAAALRRAASSSRPELRELAEAALQP